ncbi:hypothetical protein OHA25_04680 [Nonomuraea sp. NBC_00507]|uniref:hypothetical protein n=1 Tax=Nonomuraea sp. NBC_00507 TaxID=2976002 RepID=UPI002E174CB1
MTVVGRVVTAGIVAVASIVLGGSAQPATAATVTGVTQAGSSGQITSPSDGQVVSSSSVTVSARTGLMQLRMGLYVDGPSTPTQKVADGGANQTISGTFDAGNAPNGTFTVTLKGEITGTTYASSTFKLRRPAQIPGNVNASLQGTKKISVTWSKGSEPDLQSYEVANTHSGVVGRVPVDSACSGGTCEAALAVPANAAGQKVGFTVKAFRGDGDGGSIGSDESGAAYVTIPAPPAAQAKKETAKTRETPKDTRKVDPLPTLPAKKQTVPTSKPTRKPTTSRLPAIPDTDADGNLPIPTADSRGDTGGLSPAGTKEEGTDSAPVQAGDVKAQSDESPIGNFGQYGLYIAGGLLLLLLGAHAGAWARRRALAAEGGRHPQAPAVMASRAVADSEGGEVAAAVRADDGGVPVTSTPPRRRPAVILAVAKTRVPDRSPASKASSADRPHTEDASSAEGSVGEGLSSVGRLAAQRASSVDRLEIRETETSSGDSRRLHQVSGAGPRARLQELPKAALPDQAHKEVPAAAPSDGGEARAVEGVAGDAGSADEAHVVDEVRVVRQEPVRIALPSSAVTDVPESSASVLRPAVRIEDRWDDYLPPSPRSMEDSGFWERPQPGAADFWAADDDDDDDNAGDEGDEDKRAYAARRRA